MDFIRPRPKLLELEASRIGSFRPYGDDTTDFHTLDKNSTHHHQQQDLFSFAYGQAIYEAMPMTPTIPIVVSVCI